MMLPVTDGSVFESVALEGRMMLHYNQTLRKKCYIFSLPTNGIPEIIQRTNELLTKTYDVIGVTYLAMDPNINIEDPASVYRSNKLVRLFQLVYYLEYQQQCCTWPNGKAYYHKNIIPDFDVYLKKNFGSLGSLDVVKSKFKINGCPALENLNKRTNELYEIVKIKEEGGILYEAALKVYKDKKASSIGSKLRNFNSMIKDRAGNINADIILAHNLQTYWQSGDAYTDSFHKFVYQEQNMELISPWCPNILVDLHTYISNVQENGKVILGDVKMTVEKSGKNISVDNITDDLITAADELVPYKGGRQSSELAAFFERGSENYLAEIFFKKAFFTLITQDEKNQEDVRVFLINFKTFITEPSFETEINDPEYVKVISIICYLYYFYRGKQEIIDIFGPPQRQEDGHFRDDGALVRWTVRSPPEANVNHLKETEVWRDIRDRIALLVGKGSGPTSTTPTYTLQKVMADYPDGIIPKYLVLSMAEAGPKGEMYIIGRILLFLIGEGLFIDGSIQNWFRNTSMAARTSLSKGAKWTEFGSVFNRRMITLVEAMFGEGGGMASQLGMKELDNKYYKPFDSSFIPNELLKNVSLYDKMSREEQGEFNENIREKRDEWVADVISDASGGNSNRSISWIKNINTIFPVDYWGAGDHTQHGSTGWVKRCFVSKTLLADQLKFYDPMRGTEGAMEVGAPSVDPPDDSPSVATKPVATAGQPNGPLDREQQAARLRRFEAEQRPAEPATKPVAEPTVDHTQSDNDEEDFTRLLEIPNMVNVKAEALSRANLQVLSEVEKNLRKDNEVWVWDKRDSGDVEAGRGDGGWASGSVTKVAREVLDKGRRILYVRIKRKRDGAVEDYSTLDVRISPKSGLTENQKPVWNCDGEIEKLYNRLRTEGINGIAMDHQIFGFHLLHALPPHLAGLGWKGPHRIQFATASEAKAAGASVSLETVKSASFQNRWTDATIIPPSALRGAPRPHKIGADKKEVEAVRRSGGDPTHWWTCQHRARLPPGAGDGVSRVAFLFSMPLAKCGDEFGEQYEYFLERVDEFEKARLPPMKAAKAVPGGGKPSKKTIGKKIKKIKKIKKTKKKNKSKMSSMIKPETWNQLVEMVENNKPNKLTINKYK
jgi:hypothetical protein